MNKLILKSKNLKYPKFIANIYCRRGKERKNIEKLPQKPNTPKFVPNLNTQK